MADAWASSTTTMNDTTAVYIMCAPVPDVSVSCTPGKAWRAVRRSPPPMPIQRSGCAHDFQT